MTNMTSEDDDTVMDVGTSSMIRDNANTKSRNHGKEAATIEDESSGDEEHSSALHEALKRKEEGNRYFAQGLYKEACHNYQLGLLSLRTNENNGGRPSLALQVALLSNTALTWIKLERHEEAERECTKALQLIIQKQNEKQKVLDSQHLHRNDDNNNNMSKLLKRTSIEVIPHNVHAKVWYRRAQARESLGLLREAIGDLKQCQNLLNTTNSNHNENNASAYTTITPKSTIDEIQAMMNRIQQMLQTTNHQHPPVASNLAPSALLANHNTITANSCQGSMISPDYQKWAILQLLQQSQNSHHSQDEVKFHNGDDEKSTLLQQKHQREFPVKEGEAFFLIDFEWWRQWCLHVGFFTQDHQHSIDHNYAQRILNILPVGASLPTLRNNNEKHQQPSSSRRPSSPSVTYSIENNDGDSSSTSSDEEEDHQITKNCNNQKMKASLHPAPGIIDNSNLLICDTLDYTQQWRQPFSSPHKQSSSSQIYLRSNLVRGHHYEVLPREVYAALRCWFGERTPPLCLRAQSYTTTDNNNQYSNNNNNNKVCIYLYPHLRHSQQYKNNSISSESGCAACGALNASKRCTTCRAVIYCDRNCQASHWPYYKNICKLLIKQQKNQGNDISTTIQHQHNNRLILKNSSKFGRTGLNNLGNTCFMNSALQCLSHTTPLTRYFLSNGFQNDLNTQNPLGTGGKLANAFNLLLRELWMANHNSYSPTALKRAIAVFAPRFAGCAQHDAQEFLAFLLDGLHEDLNRIKHAPYVEMPEVTENKKLTIAGAEAWDAHCLRNNSLVMDTFYGQFKSTCVCPQCNRVSVSFDAFNHISLEIPTHQNNNRIIVVFVVLTANTVRERRKRHQTSFRKEHQPNYRPTRYGVLVSKNASIGEFKNSLSKLTDIPPSRLILCDMYENNVYEVLNDNKSVATIRNEDVTVAYEVDFTKRPSIHTIITHNRYVVEDDLSNYVPTEKKIMFGFPLIAIFNTETTCNQVWEYIWNQISFAIRHGIDDESDSMLESYDDKKKLLNIVITDSNGNPRPIFGNSQGYDSTQEAKARCILPKKSNERITDYLGKDFSKSFLFLSLEWGTSREFTKINTGIDYDKFSQYDDHFSLMESIQRQKELSSRVISLDKCFENFITPERLDENNKWYCSNCKAHVRAMKTMELWKLPNILIVHLKRFEFKHALRREKLDTFVDFPMEGLDMSKHCASISSQSLGDDFVVDAVPADYDLFAVTNHYGRMGFGHYTAFARRWNENGIESEWASFDDSSVQNLGDGYGRAKEIQIATSAAYVLFYRRRIFS